MDISFNKCGIAMASSGNINREIQLIIDVIDYKRFKGKYLLGMLSAHTIRLRLQLHRAIYRPDSFVLMLCYCANLKAIRYESTSLNRIAADQSHHVIVA